MHRWLAHKRPSLFAFDLLRLSSTNPPRQELYGRDILQPKDFTVEEWKRILWLAFDLKQSSMKSDRKTLNLACNKHVTLLFTKPSGRNLLSCSLASQQLGASSTYYMDPDFECQQNCIDSGRALSSITDLIFVNGCNQAALSDIAEGSCVPVIGLTTNMFSIFKGLAFLMTIQENYGFLKGLKLAWIGPPGSLCNTLLSIFPQLGINIKFCCICAHGSGQMTPVIYENAILACSKGGAEIHQCTNAAEAVYRSHVIVVASHPEEENKVTLPLLQEAELDWTLLHPLPRTEIEVSDDLFKHKNNLTWACSANHVYIAMAVIAATLTQYQPTSSMQKFER